MIYFDHSATTPLCQAAKDAITASLDTFGNPSSLHKLGLEANDALHKARTEICRAMGISPMMIVDDRLPLGAGAPEGRRLIFTACGSEADNLVIFGLLNAKKFREIPRIITTNSEHPAMLEALYHLESAGKIELKLLSTMGGVIDMNELAGYLTKNTLLVSIMAVNNETGAAYDLKKAFALTRRMAPDAVTHTDAVQGFLKIDMNPDRIGADLVTISGHKIGAPKGVGALLIKNSLLRSKRLIPLIFGGGQEGGLRSGTENTLGILALAAASSAGKAELTAFTGKMNALRALLTENLPDGVKINQPRGAYAPHIVSLCLPGVKSETMLRFLSDRGICVSSGSACSSHGGHDAYVLTAFGLTAEEADCTLRVSMGMENTEEEILTLAKMLEEGIASLSRGYK